MQIPKIFTSLVAVVVLSGINSGCEPSLKSRLKKASNLLEAMSVELTDAKKNALDNLKKSPDCFGKKLFEDDLLSWMKRIREHYTDLGSKTIELDLLASVNQKGEQKNEIINEYINAIDNIYATNKVSQMKLDIYSTQSKESATPSNSTNTGKDLNSKTEDEYDKNLKAYAIGKNFYNDAEKIISKYKIEMEKLLVQN